jgi:hypothetical protein
LTRPLVTRKHVLPIRVVPHRVRSWRDQNYF